MNDSHSRGGAATAPLEVPSCARCCRAFLFLFLTPVALSQDEDPPPPDLRTEESEASEEDPVRPGEFVLPKDVVVGRLNDLVGQARSSSSGEVGRAELLDRPRLRPGEVLETVPGLIATQHSGSGKANQFFLRGFNLDHGTDFGADIDGMPLNLPTHGHGQGYLDVNFLIPETLERLEFRKGPYHARVGDFSSAGSVSLHTVDRFQQGFTRLTLGEDDYLRVVGGDSPNEFLSYALEGEYYDGPWVEPERSRSLKLFLKLAEETEDSGRSLTFLGYRSEWDSTDQIPQRAVDSGLIGRFGTIDPTLGGNTQRYAALGEIWSQDEDHRTRLRAAAQVYDFNLWSNFTYFLDDPVLGDQFEQEDRRLTLSSELSHDWWGESAGVEWEQGVGLQLRHDWIPTVGLFRTAARARQSRVRKDRVHQSSLGLYYDHEVFWTSWLRSSLGLRGDVYAFDVDADDSRNSDEELEAILGPKAGLVVGPFWNTELTVNGGLGFHSNDARGVTTRFDPVSGAPLDPVDPLVRTRGFEVGLRTSILDGLQSTVTWFWLESDSELVFVGDAGTTEPSGESRRQGVEFANAWRPLTWLSLEADYAFTHARFTDPGPEGRYIPGALEQVASVGVHAQFENGLFGSLRWRHFGDYPLIEDDSVRAGNTDLVNLRLGVREERFEAAVEVLNVLDSDDSDIEYFFTSRLPGEDPAGVEGVHFHPVIPRSVRASLLWRF